MLSTLRGHIAKASYGGSTTSALARRDVRGDGDVTGDPIRRPTPKASSVDRRVDDPSVDERLQRLPDLPGAGRQKFAEFWLGDLRPPGRVESGEQHEKGGQREARETQTGHALEGFCGKVDSMHLVTHAPIKPTPTREVPLCGGRSGGSQER